MSAAVDDQVQLSADPPQTRTTITDLFDYKPETPNGMFHTSVGYILRVHFEAAQRKKAYKEDDQTRSKLVHQINVSQFLHNHWSQVVIAGQFLLVQEETLAHHQPVMSHTQVFIFTDTKVGQE